MKYFTDEQINKIRKGYYSAVYFNRTKYILEKEKNHKQVTMQVFQRNSGSRLCGIEEVVELLKYTSGFWEGEKWVDMSSGIIINSLSDGDIVSPWETVMHISGPYVYFAHLESIYLGILARRTLVSSKTRKVVDAASGKPVIFFADRFDCFFNQEGDGYAAYIGGATSVCTAAQAAWWKGRTSGTIPHALIAVDDGDTVAATVQFAKHIKDTPVVALVDFENDCVKTSLEVARILKEKLWAVRLDTAEYMIDKSLQNPKPKTQNPKIFGVNPTLVKLVRKALDMGGYEHVKIIASGGFNEQKITWFEKEKTPVDIYGVGSALVHGSNDFTADVVKVGDKELAKAGRQFMSLKRRRG